MKKITNIITVEIIKKIGKEKTPEGFDQLQSLYNQRHTFSSEIRREIISSIGRYKDNDKVLFFIEQHAFDEKNIMDEVYQFFRTAIYKSADPRFQNLRDKLLKYYDNEVLHNMLRYKSYDKKEFKKQHPLNKVTPLILEGNNTETLKTIPDQSVQLIFTSPPYYNAREYSIYKSYQQYLDLMYKSLVECYRVLENGRFIIYNVSPVITKRPGREFSSHRYPIHFDFHNILTKAGFTFIDEIIWIKPEAAVSNRNGGMQQTRSPLMYKPNTITESILVYRKDVGFLLDENIKKHGQFKKIPLDYKLDTSNCWYIHPSSNPLHPAVFPEELCEKIIQYYSFEDDVVLDHFAGSGTFGKVALRMKRKPIMCEQNEDYIKKLKHLLVHKIEIF